MGMKYRFALRAVNRPPRRPTVNRDRILEIERIEIEAKLQGHFAAPRETVEALGMVGERIGGAWAFGRSRDDNLYFNRVFGFGLERPGTPDDLAAFKSFYSGQGIKSFVISLSPAAEPLGLETMLASAGFGTYFQLVKWVRDASPAPPARTTLRIERATSGDGPPMGQVLVAAFNDRPETVGWIGAQIGRADWLHYVARDGERIVAVAALFVRDGFAWLGMGSTLPEARGLGAQSALIARRIEDARARGCHTIMVETAPDSPEKPNPSYRNVERAGFQIAYRRPSWVFPDSGAVAS
jgi:GNAT superfamily N-acetyltransferase